LIAEINRLKRAKSINTFDFEQMYTNIVHNELKTRIKMAIDLAFDRQNKFGSSFIAMTEKSVHWCKSKSSGVTISREKLTMWVDFLIDNTYFTFGNTVWRQIIGIPMGTSCAPLLANIFLFSYEFEYVRSTMRSDFRLCCLLKGSRLIDDLTVLNDRDQMESLWKTIYPDSLTLKKINENANSANVLDLAISVNPNHTFDVDLYDKRADFKFNVIRFPHFDSNLSFNTKRNVFISRSLAISNICSNSINFVKNFSNICAVFLNRGYTNDTVKSFIRNCFARHPEIATKHFPTMTLHDVIDNLQDAF
jgi:hypothetical protein